MASTSTQTIALEPLYNTTNNAEAGKITVPDTSNFEPSNDAIIAESRLADSQVPDGGYGWVVVLACGLLCFWFIGLTYSWGVMQAELVDLRISNPSTISFVGSLACAWISFFALLNARLIKRIGARNTALLGVLFFGTGEILSGFTTKNVGGLFFTVGVLTGCGNSLLFMVVSTLPAQYFNKKRGIANGIVYAGGGFGGATISFAMNGLLQKLGPDWTFRILGLIILATGLPAAWLIKERAPLTNVTFIEWGLFKNLRFVALFLAGSLATFTLAVPAFFLPLYGRSIGLSPSTGAGLVAGFNFSSAVGRLICGFASDYIGPVNTLFISLTISALSMLVLWMVSTSLGPLIVFVVVNGISNGGFFSTIPTVVGSVFGSRRVGVAMGMIVSGWAGGYLMGAPIAGYLLAAYGGENAGMKAYHPAILFAGSLALTSAGCVLALKVMMNKSPLKKL